MYYTVKIKEKDLFLNHDSEIGYFIDKTPMLSDELKEVEQMLDWVKMTWSIRRDEINQNSRPKNCIKDPSELEIKKVNLILI